MHAYSRLGLNVNLNVLARDITMAVMTMPVHSGWSQCVEDKRGSRYS